MFGTYQLQTSNWQISCLLSAKSRPNEHAHDSVNGPFTQIDVYFKKRQTDVFKFS